MFKDFLEYERHWLNAVALLKGQVQFKTKNRHFATLSMHYYERVFSAAEGILSSKGYFDGRIGSNLFYALEKEFAIVPYTIPKGQIGIRNYKFLTLPMRLLVYATSLYIVDLAQEYVDSCIQDAQQGILSYYGGLLRYHNTSLVLKNDNLWYRPHYQEFRKQLKMTAKRFAGKAGVVIRLDVQNYYNEVSVPRLLLLLDRNVRPRTKTERRFDLHTKTELTNFFEFIQGGEDGIPQFDNDITSTYLGYLYLLFADLAIDEELRRLEEVSDHAIIRFVDDIYVFISFSKSVKNDEQDLLTYSYAELIADRLFRRLGLRLNTKSRFFRLPDDYEHLVSEVKKVSTALEVAPSEDDEQFPNLESIAGSIVREVAKLQASVAKLDSQFAYLQDFNEHEVLKEVYNNRVESLLKRPDWNSKLQQCFDELDFRLLSARPKELVILARLAGMEHKLTAYLMNTENNNLTTQRAYIIVLILCQIEFNSPGLLRQLGSIPMFREFVKYFEQECIIFAEPGYYELGENETLRINNLAEAAQIMEQVKLRRLAQIRGDYSVGLNHLTNEVQGICRSLAKQDGNSKFDVNSVVQFLNKTNVPILFQQRIRALFDRRNTNLISHADEASTPVTQDEYLDYKTDVGECLVFVLNAIP